MGRRTGRAELDEHAEGVHSAEIDVDLKRAGDGMSRDRETVMADIRRLRSEMGLQPGTAVPLLTFGDARFVAAAAPVLKAMARLVEVKQFIDEAEFSAATQASPVGSNGDLRLALHVQIDPAAEAARLDKEITRLQGEIVKADAKLSNESFVARAKASVVDQERARVADFRQALSRLQDQRLRLGQAA